MSASEAVVAAPTAAPVRQPQQSPPHVRLAEWLSPRQGWDTFLMLAGVVGLAAWTVREADWVDTPGLMRIVLWSCLAGLLLAKVRAPWPLLHVAGLALGAVVVVWQASPLTEGQTPADQLRDIWHRLGAWYEAATTGEISTDLLPFTLMLLTFAWLLGYVGSWSLFRSTNVWVVLVLAGMAILTNLSFLPDDFTTRVIPLDIRIEFLFFLFILLAMILLMRVSMYQRLERWRRAGIETISEGKLLAVPTMLGLSLVVVALAAALPLKVYVSQTAVEVWNLGRSPITGLEDEFGRLFSGVAARKDVTGRFFGKTLPFQGKLSFDGGIVLWAKTAHPSYWLSRSYSQYTSQGWIAGETRKQTVGPDALPPPPQESFKRVPVYQRLYLTFDTDVLLTGGNVDWVSRDAVVETLAPMRFEIDLVDSSGDGQFPKDIANLASELRRELSGQPADLVASTVSQMLPVDIVFVDVGPESGGQELSAAKTVILERKEPILPDVVSWKFSDRFEAGDSYEMRTFVSEAENEDLSEAGAGYSGFLTDHYLQVPASLPQRVRDLATRLTADAETPLDKVLAIQDYLRGPDFEYSQDIDRPPRNTDGVDHFLFETRKAYSDYFASAMAVMLRTVNVPARLAAGYAPGEAESDPTRRAIRDSDSHGWTQVYFPGHGWIDFEPTPIWPVLAYGEPGSPEDDGQDDGNDARPDDFPVTSNDEVVEECADPEGFLPGMFLLEELCDVAPNLGGFDPDALARAARDEGQFPVVPLAVSGIAAAALIWLAGWLVWTWALAHATPAERAYTKMSRFGALAGIRRRAHQTPIEYATVLGNAIPRIAAGVQSLAWAFAVGRYGNQESDGEASQDEPDPEEEWRNVRGMLLAAGLRRLIPGVGV